MGGTHFLQTGYLLLNRNAPYVFPVLGILCSIGPYCLLYIAHYSLWLYNNLAIICVFFAIFVLY